MTDVLSAHNLTKVEDLRDLLDTTEDLEEYLFDYGGDMQVQLEWKPEAVEKLLIVFGERNEDGVGDEYALTQASAEHLFKLIKLPPAVLDSVPIEYTLPLLNWFLKNRAGSLKALIKNNRHVVAFCRPGTEIYSSTDILDRILKVLKGTFGHSDVLVNNVSHDLNLTTYTLLLPEAAEQLDNGEVLVTGLHVQTSVLGLKPLLLNGVVARDYHFNNMISETNVAQWSRKQAKRTTLDEIVEDEGESYDVFDWLDDTVADLFAQNNNDIVNVKRLQNLSLSGHSSEFLSDVFGKFSIPTGVRNAIRLAYAEEPDQTIYSLWNAITEAANDSEVQEKPALVRKLMEVGGAIAFHPESCPSCHRLRDDLD